MRHQPGSCREGLGAGHGRDRHEVIGRDIRVNQQGDRPLRQWQIGWQRAKRRDWLRCIVVSLQPLAGGNLMVAGAVDSRADPVAIVAIGVVVGYAALARTTNARWVTAVGWAVVAVAVLPSGIGLMGEVVDIIRDTGTSNSIHTIGVQAASSSLLIAAALQGTRGPISIRRRTPQ